MVRVFMYEGQCSGHIYPTYPNMAKVIHFNNYLPRWRFFKQLGVISHIENWQTRVCTEAWKLCSSAVCKHAHKDAHALATEHE